MPPTMAPALEGPGLEREVVELALEAVSGEGVVVSDDDGEVDSAEEALPLPVDDSVDDSANGVEDTSAVVVAVTFHGTDCSEMTMELGKHRNVDGGGFPGNSRVPHTVKVPSTQNAVPESGTEVNVVLLFGFSRQIVANSAGMLVSEAQSRMLLSLVAHVKGGSHPT